MDEMDIDHVPHVPDTPDRLTAQSINDKSIMERGNNLSTSGCLGNSNCFDKVTNIQFKVKDNSSGKFLMGAPESAVAGLMADHRNSSDIGSRDASSSNNSSTLQRRLIDEIPNHGCKHRQPSKTSKSVCDHHSSSDIVSRNSSSYNNSSTLRRMSDEIPNHGRKHLQRTKNDKPVCAQSYACQDGSVVDMTECNVHDGVSKNVPRSEAPVSTLVEEYGKRLPIINRMSSSNSMANSTITSPFANNGEGLDNIVSGYDSGNVVNCAHDTQPKAGKVLYTSLSSTSLPRVTGQKRLVRNGCISPHNIARAKQSVVKDKNASDIGVNHTVPVASSLPQSTTEAKDWSSEDHGSHARKGKGVMCVPLSVKDPDAQSTHLPSRNSVNIIEIVKEAGDNNRDASGGWRSTRNRSKKTSFPFSHENQCLPREKLDPCMVNGLPPYIVERGENGSVAGTSNSNPLDLEEISSPDISLSTGQQRTSRLKPQLGTVNRHHAAANTQQKHGFISSSHGECCRATMGNADIVCLGLPENSGKSRTTKTIPRNTFNSLEPVIEIDETNTEARGDGSSNAGSSSIDATAMARQIEADEMLARELQEQFYNESPSVAIGEIDMRAALALQHGELSNVFSRRSPASRARRSSSTNSSRQSRSSSALSLLRRGSQARAPTQNRMAGLRNHFPGRPRTISSSIPRSSLFPAAMDVEHRMHILEAIEAISDMGMGNEFLQVLRDNNENDYEMLLALDENNHQHAGASTARINGLPQSTVQIDNLEEACAICLETPTRGDTIRHLPCLHKFHKDCIDPWLRRKPSCPVCKSSVT